MKKFLLSASVLILASTAFAATDGQTYEPKNGYTCENLWVFDRFHTGEAYGASKIAVAQARTATTDGETVYVGLSGETATIEKYSVATGEYLGALDLKLNGEAYAGTLAANQVGFDEYGNFYVASYSANSDGAGGLAVYTCNLETGELTSVGELSFQGGLGRVDYCDVVGDLTGVNAAATVMAAASAQDHAPAGYRPQCRSAAPPVRHLPQKKIYISNGRRADVARVHGRNLQVYICVHRVFAAPACIPLAGPHAVKPACRSSGTAKICVSAGVKCSLRQCAADIVFTSGVLKQRFVGCIAGSAVQRKGYGVKLRLMQGSMRV